MSHFKVIVIGDDIEGSLQPYHEFECTGVDDQYVVDIDITDQVQKEFDRSEEYESIKEYLEDYYGISTVNHEDDIDLEDDHKYGYAIIQDDTLIKVIDRTNPNKKWDWWQIGGRWDKCLITKDGTKVNSAYKNDIDFEAIRNEYAKPFLEDYDKYWEVARTKQLQPFRTWESLSNVGNIDDRRAIYRNQEQYKIWNELQLGWDTNEEIILNQDRNVYESNIKKQALCGYAMIYKGEWIAKGDMGWWGISSETDQSKLQYYDIANKIIENLPDDEIITIVDCHI